MQQLRQVRRRIKSVKSTQQITKTMEMVAAAKIRKAQARIEAARPYALKMVELLKDVAYSSGEVAHPLLKIPERIEKTLVVLVTSNRGLCGAFNTNAIRRAGSVLEREGGEGKKVNLVTVGKKSSSYFKFIGRPPAKEYLVSDEPRYAEALEIANYLIEQFTSGAADRIYLVFNHFKSLLEQRPVEHRLLPVREGVVKAEEVEGLEERRGEFLFEPSPQAVLERLLPNYVRVLVFRALLESVASEHAARRAAMKAATDNAEEMIKNLTLVYNKARQAQITQEITEITTCAEAIRYSKQRGA